MNKVFNVFINGTDEAAHDFYATMPACTGRAQRNHIFIAISAWLQKYQWRVKHKISFYQQDWIIIKNSIATQLKMILAHL